MSSGPSPSPSWRDVDVPAPLVVAASLVAVEAMVLVLYGVAEIVATSADRLLMGVTTAAFFLGYGVALGACAWLLTRRRSWARSPVVLAQLIQLGVAWSFWGEGTTPVAVSLAAVALVVLAGIFHPASISALVEDR